MGSQESSPQTGPQSIQLFLVKWSLRQLERQFVSVGRRHDVLLQSQMLCAAR